MKEKFIHMLNFTRCTCAALMVIGFLLQVFTTPSSLRIDLLFPICLMIGHIANIMYKRITRE